MREHITIVIVDDKEMITDLFDSYIKLFYQNVITHCFNDSRKALEFVVSHKTDIDIVITDYRMPEVNGMQLLDATKPDTIRILISGYVPIFDEDKLLHEKVLLLEKPVPMKKIGKIIEDKLSA